MPIRTALCICALLGGFVLCQQAAFIGQASERVGGRDVLQAGPAVAPDQAAGQSPLREFRVQEAVAPEKVWFAGSGVTGRKDTRGDGKQWLLLRVEMTPAKAGVSLGVRDIRIVEDGSAFAPAAGVKDPKSEGFHHFEDFDTTLQASNRGSAYRAEGMLVAEGNGASVFLMRGKEDLRPAFLWFVNEAPAVLPLLFAVSSGSRPLELAIGGARQPVPGRRVSK